MKNQLSTISDVALLINRGITPKYTQTGKVRLVKSAHVNPIKIKWEQSPFITEPSLKLNNFFLKNGDILLNGTGTGSVGRVGIVDNIPNDYYIPDSHVNLIRVDSKIVNPWYLFFWLNSPYGQQTLTKFITGSTNQVELSAKKVAQLEFPYVSLANQNYIVRSLTIAYEIIQKRKKTINYLDEYIKSVFLEMFGDPVENTKHWDVKKLKDMSLKILSGNTPKGGAQVYVKNGVLFLRSQNVWRNRLDLADVAFISEETHEKMRNSSLEYKDIVMTKTGRINTENSSLGRAAIYLGENNRANINGHVYLIRLKKDAVHEFVLFILTTNEYREYIRRICVGGIDKRQVNKVHLEEFPIISPPIELQNRFLEIVNKTESIKQKMLLQSRKLDTQFHALMQKSFKGN